MTEPKSYFVSSLLQSEPEYAGFWMRVLAIFLDVLVLALFFGVIISVCVFIMYAMNPNLSVEAGKKAIKSFNVASDLLALISGWLYFAGLESSAWQATLGKKICGMKVTDLEGQRLTFVRSSCRYWGHMISAVICYVGYFMVAFTEKKQALHDMIMGTLVVKAD